MDPNPALDLDPDRQALDDELGPDPAKMIPIRPDPDQDPEHRFVRKFC
jgi:hypothetical protein